VVVVLAEIAVVIVAVFFPDKVSVSHFLSPPPDLSLSLCLSASQTVCSVIITQLIESLHRNIFILSIIGNSNEVHIFCDNCLVNVVLQIHRFQVQTL